MLSRSIFRTIRSSFGRYVAILAIIALGVGFFAGLRVSEATMLATGDGYLKDQNLYDLRLISTLGLTEEDVSAFSELPGVDQAIGSVSADAIFLTEDGADAVFHAHTLLQGMNGLDVLRGRLPETADECVIDSRYAGADGVLGKEIVFSPNNSQETRDSFARERFTVVGIVDSSEYIYFQRGTTSLAGGTVAGFMYLLPEAFATDYYTEIFLDVSAPGAIFSGEYEAAIEAISQEAEALLTQRGELRYQTLYNDAKAELDDAQSQLDEKTAELADAELKVRDGWETYQKEREDAEAELADAKKQLEDANIQLVTGWIMLNDADKAPAISIPEIKAEIDVQEQVLLDQEALYDTNLAVYQQAYQDAMNGFAAAEQQLQAGQAEIDAGTAVLEGKRAELTAAQQTLNAGWETFRAEKAAAEAGLSQSKAQLDGARAALDGAWAALEAAKQSPEAQLPEVMAQLAAQEANLQAQEAAYAAGLAAYEQAYGEAMAGFAATEQMLTASQAELDAGAAQLEQSAAALALAQQQLDSGWAAYQAERTAAEQKLAESKALLDNGRSQLDAGWAALNAAKNAPAGSIPEVRAQLNYQKNKLSQSQDEYETGLADYEKAYQEAQDGFAEAEQELSDAQAELDEAREEALPEIADAQQEINDGWEELGKLEPATVYVLDRSSNFGYASFENDIAIVSGVAKVFPLFFFLVAALVCITTMTRMVSEQRTHNGVLKAMGYSNGAVVSQYLVYAGSASVLGCICGFLLGSKFMPLVLWEIYHIMYTVNRSAVFVLDWGLFAGCSALYLGCALGATWMVCHKDLKESAAQLIRPKAPEAGKRVLLERITFLWKRLKFLHKVSIRNILLYKKRMVMMMIGVGGCMALLLAGFGIRDTIQPVVNNQYGEISLYDAAVSFVREPDAAELQEFLLEAEAMTSHRTLLHSGNTDVLIDDLAVSSGLVVYGEDISSFVDLHAGEIPVVWPGRGEAVVNYRFAQENGLSVGDPIQLCDSDYRSMTVTVSGIYDNYIGDTIYVSRDTCLESWAYAPEINTAWLRFVQNQDEHEAGAKLLGLDNVAAISLTSDFKETVGSMLNSMDYIVLIVLVCAGALAFIVLYNLTNITITERIREIATLKVLGFTAKEQNAYVFRENLILTAMSTLFGLPFGMFLLRYVMDQIKISSFYFGYRLEPISYVLAVGITFVFTFFVDQMLTVKMKRINMTEALKTIE